MSGELYCYRHPERETVLRCNRCEKPICAKCAVKVPTGYRCVECVKNQQQVFDTAQSTDYIFAVVIAGILSLIGSFLITRLGFITIFLAPGVAEAVRRAVSKRRSKTLFRISAAAAAIASIPALLVTLVPLFFSLSANGFNIYLLWPLLWQGLYTMMVSSSVYYRLSGIQLNR